MPETNENGRMESRDDVLQDTSEKLGDVENTMIDGRMKQALVMTDPQEIHDTLMKGQERYLGNLQSAIDTFARQKDMLQPQLHAVLTAADLDESVGPEIDKILEALTTDTPEYGEKPKSRYLKMAPHPAERKVIKEKWVHYHLAPEEMFKDKKFLEDLAARLPRTKEAQEPIMALQGMLYRMASYDVQNMQAFAMMQEQRNDYSTQAIYKMLGITAVLGLTAIALVTGVATIANKKVPLNSALLLGLAWFIASPSLRRSMFGSEQETVLAEVDKKLNDKKFQKAAMKNGIEGEGWKTGMIRLHENEGLRSQDVAHASPAQKDAMAEELIHEKDFPKDHKNARRVLDHPEEFASLVAVAETNNADAWNTCLDYVKLGCSRYLKDMGNIETRLSSEPALA